MAWETQVKDQGAPCICASGEGSKGEKWRERTGGSSPTEPCEGIHSVS